MSITPTLSFKPAKNLQQDSIDGDTDTNDTVLSLLWKIWPSSDDSPELLQAFREAVFMVCDTLAEKIGDGEKITKLVELIVMAARPRKTKKWHVAWVTH